MVRCMINSLGEPGIFCVTFETQQCESQFYYMGMDGGSIFIHQQQLFFSKRTGFVMLDQ